MARLGPGLQGVPLRWSPSQPQAWPSSWVATDSKSIVRGEMADESDVHHTSCASKVMSTLAISGRSVRTHDWVLARIPPGPSMGPTWRPLTRPRPRLAHGSLVHWAPAGEALNARAGSPMPAQLALASRVRSRMAPAGSVGP